MSSAAGKAEDLDRNWWNQHLSCGSDHCIVIQIQKSQGIIEDAAYGLTELLAIHKQKHSRGPGS